MKKNVVIYHRADFDGIFCREIARKFLGDTAEYIGWDYGDIIPVIDGLAQVYMLDISIDGIMEAHDLIWIDHHKSAIEKYPKSIPGYRIDGVAACRLAWQWFTESHKMVQRQAIGIPPLPLKEEFIGRKVSEPIAVRLAGEYDIWDKRDTRAELFQHGLRSIELSQNIWRELLSDTWRPTVDEIESIVSLGKKIELHPDGTADSLVVNELLKRGEAIQFSQTEQNKSIIKEIGFTFEWEGLKFLACNHARYNSHLFTAGLTSEHDACFGFKWDGQKKVWSISLYHAPGKEHHDLSLIASKYGGGGHRGACGFRTKNLPFMSE